MKLAFIVLAHHHPQNVARLVQHLANAGATVVVHYDLKSPREEFVALQNEMKRLPNVILTPRIDVGWGQWSMVKATLAAIEALAATTARFDYVHLMSGDDYPIRPIEWLGEFLAPYAGNEFIETMNIRQGTWVKGGLEHERYQYKHIHNWRTDQKKFDRYWTRQRDRNQKREFLAGIDPFLGSQWWTLTWASCLGALKWSEDPDVARFFETVWIPDEMFFQTYIGNNVSSANVLDLTLTLYQFDRDGVPITYYDDHLNYLARQNFFFARKLSPMADALRDGIDLFVKQRRQSGVQIGESIGQRTNELSETLELHRWGLPNRRRVGYAGDPWYGDLEWNRNNYIVIASTSRPAAERVREALADSDFTICHGELFGTNRIDFARNAARFAGYGAKDVALRNHKVANFLVDVIKAGHPAMTCFILILEKTSEIQEILIWDPRAHFILVRVDVVEAYLEWRRQQDNAFEVGEAMTPNMLAEPTEFALIARADMAADRSERPVVETKLGHAGKKPFVVTEFRSDWEERLRSFAFDTFNSEHSAALGRSRAPVRQTRRPSAAENSDPTRILRLIQAIPDAGERDRRLFAKFSPFAPEGGCCVVAMTSSADDQRVIAAFQIAFPSLEWMTIRYVPMLVRTGASGDGPRDGTAVVSDMFSISCARYQLSGVEPAHLMPLLSMVMADARSEVLVFTPHLETLLTDSLGDRSDSSSADEGVSERLVRLKNSLRKSFGDMREIARRHKKLIWPVDLADPMWFAEVMDFARHLAGKAGEIEDPDRIAKVLRRVLAGQRDPGDDGAPQIRRTMTQRTALGIDFRWALEPYIVVATTSRLAAERIRATLDGFDFVVCHGELFGPTRIGFVDDRAEYGGYRAGDVKARDMRVFEFLGDIVRTGWPSITGFVLVVDGQSGLIDALVRDPRARFVVLEANVIDAFLAQHAHARGDGRPARTFSGSLGLEEASLFRTFAAKLAANDARVRPALIQKLAAAHKAPLLLDTLDEDWIERLKRFAIEIAIRDARDEPESVRAIAERITAVPNWQVGGRDVGYTLKLIGAILGDAERDRYLRAYFSPIGKGETRYVVVFVLSTADERLVETLAKTVPHFEWVVVRYTPSFIRSMAGPHSARRAWATDEVSFYGAARMLGGTELTGSVVATKIAPVGPPEPADEREPKAPGGTIEQMKETYSIVCQKYRIPDIAPQFAAPLLNLLIRDPRAKLLGIRGNAFAMLADFVGWKGDVTALDLDQDKQKLAMASVVAGSEDFLAKMRGLTRECDKSVVELDLLAENCSMELISFVRDICADDRLVSVDERKIRAALRETMTSAPDLSLPFGNPVELIEAIRPLPRQVAHRLLVGSVSR